MSDLVGNPEDRFSRVEARLLAETACYRDPLATLGNCKGEVSGKYTYRSQLFKASLA